MPRGRVDIDALVEGVRSGAVRSIAQAISLVERDAPECSLLLEGIADSNEGAPTVLGITGPPGAGKSTLTDRLIHAHRRDGRRVAVLAVDPSSPFSGGALLGDRVRMERHNEDDGVFIRSMATRGHHGGLSAAAYDTVAILAAARFDTILVESVGVGQSETGVLSLSDLVLLVLNPGAGDEIQALKAGIMEIADIFVLNKADQPGIHDLERAIRRALRNDGGGTSAEPAASPLPSPPPIVRTAAINDEGIDELVRTVEDRLQRIRESGELEQRHRRRRQSAAEDVAVSTVRAWLQASGAADTTLAELRRRLHDLLNREDER